MTTLTVTYPRSEGATFDHDYYEATHLPLVTETWRDAGLKGAQALRGLAAPDGGPPAYFAIAMIRFDSPDALKAAIGSPAAGQIMSDIPNFTNVRPVVQVNAEIGG